MPLMPLESVRVVDPILTTVVQGYGTPEFVGSALFPKVDVLSRSGRIIEFGRGDFVLFGTRRAPGGPTRRRGLEYGSARYELYQDALEGELPMEYLEEAKAGGIPFSLQEETAKGAMRSLDLNLEYAQAAEASNFARYDANHKITLSGSSLWTNPASDPTVQVTTWKEAVRRSIGAYPNTAVLGASGFQAAVNHPSIRDQIKYTSADSVTPDMLAKIWGLAKLVVGEALALNENTNDLFDVWGDSFYLAYVPKVVSSNRSPSFGYTYTLKGYPIVEEPYYERNHKTWYFPVTAERQPLVTSIQAGFLAKNLTGAAV